MNEAFDGPLWKSGPFGLRGLTQVIQITGLRCSTGVGLRLMGGNRGTGSRVADNFHIAHRKVSVLAFNPAYPTHYQAVAWGVVAEGRQCTLQGAVTRPRTRVP